MCRNLLIILIVLRIHNCADFTFAQEYLKMFLNFYNQCHLIMIMR